MSVRAYQQSIKIWGLCLSLFIVMGATLVHAVSRATQDQGAGQSDPHHV